MKRNTSTFSLDGDQNGEKRHNWSLSFPSTSNNSESQLPESTQNKTSENNQNNDQQNVGSQNLPSTTTPSFPWFGFGSSDYCSNVDSSQNPFMMPFQNRMFNMALPDSSMQINSTNVPFTRSLDSTSNISSNTNEANLRQGSTVARSPSPIPPYSLEESKIVADEMKETQTLRRALGTLIKWLEKGECTKNTNNDFVSLIQYAHHQVWRLMSEKSQLKDDLTEVKKELSLGMSGISSQFEEICKVLEVSKLQKVWDQFTKPQRKQIATWREEANQLKGILSTELHEDSEDIDEDSCNKSPDSSMDHEKEEMKKEFQKLQEEMDNLRNQIVTLQEENSVLKQEIDTKNNIYQNTISGFVDQSNSLEDNLTTLKKFKSEADELKKKKEEMKSHSPRLSLRPTSDLSIFGNADNIQLGKREIQIVTLVGTFLFVHPYGASIDYIGSYLVSIDSSINDTRYVESLLKKLPQVFQEKSTGVGATLMKKWFFCGFDTNLN